MKGKSKLLAQIKKSTNLEFLRGVAEDLHTAADYAALDDRDRDFNDLCDCEDACEKRIAELKGGTK